ncbi:hypothetical protein KEJ19_06220 [Candidatus Bathyarchaeota archaeon]|nr:hypothetical protein [Candidatus Bathyarchaeota archaeon]
MVVVRDLADLSEGFKAALVSGSAPISMGGMRTNRRPPPSRRFAGMPYG